MRKTLFLLVVFLSFFSINAQEIQNDSLFTNQQRIKLLELGLQKTESYNFEDTQINSHLQDILKFDRKRNRYLIAGDVVLSVGVLTTIMGLILNYEDGYSYNADEITVIEAGMIISASSIPFFANALLKRNKRNQRIREAKKLF